MADLELIRMRPRGAPSKLRQWLTSLRSFTLGPYNPRDPELARLFSGGRMALSGVPVSEATAMNYAAVFAAVTLISEQIATVPLVLYKRDKDGTKTRFIEHPLYRLLHDRPNPFIGSMVFRRQLTANRLVWGNGYAEIERDIAGRPKALWPLMPYQVKPFYTASGDLMYRVHNQGGGTVDFDAADILHIRGIGSGDGTVGDSLIPYARESLGLGMAAEKFGSAFFGNGSTFGGIISYPAGVGGNIETRKENREAIERLHAGVERAHRFLALYEGAKYEQVGVPPEAAQFLETREFQIEEVCRWFNVPPHKLKHLKRSTNNNIEQQSIEFQTDTLNPHWTEWEEELTAKLIAPSELNIQVIEHVRQGLMQADAVSRGEYVSKVFSVGALTQNDVRRIENLNPLPPEIKPEIPYVPVNMMPADQARAYWAANIEKTKAEAERAKQPPPAPVAPQPTPDQQNAWEQAILEARKVAQQAEDLRDLARAETAVLKEEIVGLNATIAGLMGERDAAKAAQDEADERALVELVRMRAAQDERDAALIDWDVEQRARVAAENLASFNFELSVTADLRTLDAQKARDEALAQRQTVEQERDAALARLAGVEQERDVARQDARAAQTQADAARADLTAAIDTIAAMAIEERAQQADADSLRADLARARADIAAELDRAKTQRGVLLVAMRSLFVDVSKRLLQRESDPARKHQTTPEKLRSWVESFYPMHAFTCRSAFQPLIAPWVAVAGGDADALLDKLVAEHVETSRRALALVLDAEDADEQAGLLERTLTRWETERPDAMADALVREGIKHG